MKTKDLYKTSKLVHEILLQDERTRNSDSFLYLKVLGVLGLKKGIDIDSMSITTFLLNMTEYGFPPFESVRRARQKIQHEHPELAGNRKIKEYRQVNKGVYMNFALNQGRSKGELQ